MLSLSNSDSNSAINVSISKNTQDAEYYLDTALFQVEGTLYKVAKYHFLKSEDLTATFAKHKSEHDIISLNDVSRDDFRTLLRLLYPLSIISTNNFMTEEWIAVLKLSTRWKMLYIRNLAIRQLNGADIDPIDRVSLAQKYHVPWWLISSFVLLVRREDSLSTDEAEKLGFELALKICRIRDSSRILPDVLDDDAWNSAIGVEFQDELQLRAIPPAEQVVLARKTGVLEFLRASYVALIERPEPLSNDEAMELGCETTARICRIREQCITQNLPTISSMCLIEHELQAELGTMKGLSAIQRVLASMHVAKWYQLSLAEVAQIRQFSGDEVKKLGDNIAFRLYRVREAVCSTQWGKKSPEICQTLVNREFSDEIGALRAEAKAYSGTKGTSTTEKIVGLVEHLEQPFDCGAHKEKETALCRDELRFEVQPPISKPQQTTKVKKRF